MRKAFILAAIILQVMVLAYMAGEREYILKNGKLIHLRTAPVDPRDLFRGDYVRLNYEISGSRPISSSRARAFKWKSAWAAEIKSKYHWKCRFPWAATVNP